MGAHRTIGCLMAALLLWGAQAATAGPRIGVTSAVVNSVTGTLAGPVRVLRTGDGVFQHELVATGRASSAQLLFLDETSLTVGPNSRVTLDRFVYDPNRKTGDIVINITKGAFRFVSGSAKSSSYKIRTPVAVIGVRGTIIEGLIDAIGNLFLILVEGAFEVCPIGGGACVVVDQPGTFVKVSSTGAISGPDSWRGQLLNIQGPGRFPFGDGGDFINRGGITGESDLNQALDNRDVDVRFPQAPSPSSTMTTTTTHDGGGYSPPVITGEPPKPPYDEGLESEPGSYPEMHYQQMQPN